MIRDLEDLQVMVLEYCKENLNSYIDEINGIKNDKYKIDRVDPTNFVIGEEIRDRRMVKSQFNISEARVDLHGNEEGSILVEIPHYVCVVLFADQMTQLEYRRGLRYRRAVMECIKSLSAEEININLVDFVNDRVNPEGTQGLRASGVLISVGLL